MRENLWKWIRQILRGDRDAGEQFVTDYYPDLYRFLRGLTGETEVAKDLTQQTFVRAWESLDRFQYRSSLRTWLHRIAYHEYTHWLRDRKQTSPLETARGMSAPEHISDWEMFDLPNAMEQLTPELCSAFLLFHVQELSIKEVADILEIPAGTVKSRLYIARQRLRELLEANGSEQSGNPIKSLSVNILSEEETANELLLSQAQREAR